MSDHVPFGRLVVIGRNSRVWTALSRTREMAAIDVVAISHAELKSFPFCSHDRVWVLSYSRSVAQNRILLEYLSQCGDIDVTYVSSASTNVVKYTRCYNYPTVKYQAEMDAIRLCNARIVTIGWFYVDSDELPAGRTAATSAAELAAFMTADSSRSSETVKLFQMINRPFTNTGERVMFSLYGLLLKASGRFPCLLRPIDLFLRAIKMRWYGYLYLSNQLWSTTT
jgi:hypothetical protein